jgi:large subunit ribosomal protein L6
MSRVGKNEVKIPQTVSFDQEGQFLTFKGKNGTSSYHVPNFFNIEKTNDGFFVKPQEAQNMTKKVKMLWGTTQRNISNIVMGLDKGFTRNIDLVGVGYRASVSGSTLTLQLGFSHDILYQIPEGVKIKCDKPTTISVFAASKEQVGHIVAKLCSYRPPEPYKGKGMIREGQYVLRKEGKKK